MATKQTKFIGSLLKSYLEKNSFSARNTHDSKKHRDVVKLCIKKFLVLIQTKYLTEFLREIKVLLQAEKNITLFANNFSN